MNKALEEKIHDAQAFGFEEFIQEIQEDPRIKKVARLEAELRDGYVTLTGYMGRK